MNPSSSTRRLITAVVPHTIAARCKKLRKLWMRTNEWWPPGGRISSMNVPGEGKVCWICRIREVQPGWHPGMSIPELPHQTKFKP